MLSVPYLSNMVYIYIMFYICVLYGLHILHLIYIVFKYSIYIHIYLKFSIVFFFLNKLLSI